MLTVKLILERLDREGRLLERREQLSRSFTKGFLGLLYVAHAFIQYDAPYSMTDIDGVVRSIDRTGITGSHAVCGTMTIGSCCGNGAIQIASGQLGVTQFQPHLLILKGENIGIQVGTGTNAVTPTDTALQTRVAHGRSAGELEYGGCELVGIAFVNPDGEFTIRRYFTNASGGAITINEVGIYAAGKKISTSTPEAYVFLIARDIVSPGVAVADGEILRATYVPQITV